MRRSFLLAPAALAQTLQTGFADFGTDNSAPIEIEADELEVQDKQNTAVFLGNVTVRQEDAALQTAASHGALCAVGATGKTPARGARSGGPHPRTPQNQRNLAPTGGRPRPDHGPGGQAGNRRQRGPSTSMRERLSLAGNVTLSQDGNVVTGDSLSVDLDTAWRGVTSSSRVRVLLNPGGAAGD